MWKNALFSDESSIKQFSARKYRVWRPPGTRYTEKFVIPTVKQPPSQMIWWAMCRVLTKPAIKQFTFLTQIHFQSS